MNRKSALHTLLVAAAIVLSLATGFVLALAVYTPTPGLPPQFSTLADVWESLDQYYVEQDALDPVELSQGAIEGMLDALDDPYTSYLDPDTYEVERTAFEGSFEGVGAVVTMEDDQLTVVSPISGGPAQQQGIRAGDIIVEIDGEPTAGMMLTEAVLKIRGPQGTKVTLLILHHGEDVAEEIQVVREEIELDSVSVERVREGIVRVQITHFSERTHGELQEALVQAISTHVDAAVLDLRNNPGGYLDVVLDVADEFLDGGAILYQQRVDGTLDETEATPGGMVTELPLVVLVNGASASGSEVLAGALRDHGRAELVGTVTYGKGSVNLLLELDDGSAFYVTTARWLTPDGDLIEGQGLTPDHVVELTEEDILNERDPQLEAAIDLLQTPP